MERKRRKDCCGWTFLFWEKSSLWENRSGEVLMPDGTAYQLVWKLERKQKRTCFICFPGKTVRLRSGWENRSGQ